MGIDIDAGIAGAFIDAGLGSKFFLGAICDENM